MCVGVGPAACCGRLHDAVARMLVDECTVDECMCQDKAKGRRQVIVVWRRGLPSNQVQTVLQQHSHLHIGRILALMLLRTAS